MSDFQAHAICIRITRSLRILPHSVAQACPFMIKHMICYMLRSFATFDEKSSNGPKSGNILYPEVIKCVGVTLESALQPNHITSLYHSVIKH